MQLLNRLDALSALGAPVLVGLSRKRVIGEVTGKELPDRLAGSVAAATIAAMNGAAIVRVHDVAATVDAMNMIAATVSEGFTV